MFEEDQSVWAPGGYAFDSIIKDYYQKGSSPYGKDAGIFKPQEYGQFPYTQNVQESFGGNFPARPPSATEEFILLIKALESIQEDLAGNEQYYAHLIGDIKRFFTQHKKALPWDYSTKTLSSDDPWDWLLLVSSPRRGKDNDFSQALQKHAFILSKSCSEKLEQLNKMPFESQTFEGKYKNSLIELSSKTDGTSANLQALLTLLSEQAREERTFWQRLAPWLFKDQFARALPMLTNKAIEAKNAHGLMALLEKGNIMLKQTHWDTIADEWDPVTLRVFRTLLVQRKEADTNNRKYAKMLQQAPTLSLDKSQQAAADAIATQTALERRAKLTRQTSSSSPPPSYDKSQRFNNYKTFYHYIKRHDIDVAEVIKEIKALPPEKFKTFLLLLANSHHYEANKKHIDPYSPLSCALFARENDGFHKLLQYLERYPVDEAFLEAAAQSRHASALCDFFNERGNPGAATRIQKRKHAAPHALPDPIQQLLSTPPEQQFALFVEMWRENTSMIRSYNKVLFEDFNPFVAALKGALDREKQYPPVQAIQLCVDYNFPPSLLDKTFFTCAEELKNKGILSTSEVALIDDIIRNDSPPFQKALKPEQIDALKCFREPPKNRASRYGKYSG